uniref:LCCL domain-containing protein n=1 Tax=Amphiprion percula TaxID=161767 RepID=A0A3P8UC04_AMPPE
MFTPSNSSIPCRRALVCTVNTLMIMLLCLLLCETPSASPACDVRAGKINVSEFIVKCPAHCKETKQQVYGTGVFASISSICNAAIHRLTAEG